MSAKKESPLSIAAALEKIGCSLGDKKQIILTKFQAALKKSTLTEEVSLTLNLLTYDYANNAYFTDAKKSTFFELLNNESQENIDYILELHQENYSSIVADAARFGYADIVKNETWKGIKSAGNATWGLLSGFANSSFGLFSSCMPQLQSGTPHVDMIKKMK